MKKLSKINQNILQILNKYNDWMTIKDICEQTQLTIANAKGHIVELQARKLVISKIENGIKYYKEN